MFSTIVKRKIVKKNGHDFKPKIETGRNINKP